MQQPRTPSLRTGREDFDRELGQLEAELALMEGMVETALFNSLRALSNRDLELSRRVIAEDDRIDQKQVEIELGCLELIRSQAPMAGDLRRIVSMLQVASELERMGDYAEGIGKISLKMGHEPPIKELVDIPRMGDLAVSMLKRSLEAFLEKDQAEAERKAATLGTDDDEVDALYERVVLDLLEIVKSSPDKSERATYLMWAAHNVERVADRATNIAERAIFQATGRMVSGQSKI